jgi:hypothetical protein
MNNRERRIVSDGIRNTLLALCGRHVDRMPDCVLEVFAHCPSKQTAYQLMQAVYHMTDEELVALDSARLLGMGLPELAQRLNVEWK